MSTSAVMGWEGLWAFEDSNADPSTATFDTSSTFFPVVSDTFGLAESYGETEGNRGTRLRVSEQTWLAEEAFSGELVLEASPLVLEFFFPEMTGDATSAHTFADSLGDGFDYIRYDGSTNKVYRNVLISNWTLEASSGGKMMLRLGLVGRNETRSYSYSDWQALSTNANAAPYIASTITLTGGNPSSARDIEDISISCDHFLEPRRYMNTAPQCYVHSQPRLTQITSTSHWGSTNEAQLYGNAQAGLAATIAATQGTWALSISVSKLQIPRQTPGITGQGETKYPIAAFARGTGTTSELSISHTEP